MDGNPDLSSTDITSINSLSQISENVNNKFSEKIGKAEYENVIKYAFYIKFNLCFRPIFEGAVIFYITKND